jgi:hypothetical protein
MSFQLSTLLKTPNFPESTPKQPPTLQLDLPSPGYNVIQNPATASMIMALSLLVLPFNKCQLPMESKMSLI